MSTTKAYWEKLQDPRWQRRRLEIMQRDGFKCTLCGGADRQLQVHHRRYEKRTQPWDYADDSLTTLCDECHEKVTELKNHIGYLISHPRAWQLYSAVAAFDKPPRTANDIDETIMLLEDFIGNHESFTTIMECYYALDAERPVLGLLFSGAALRAYEMEHLDPPNSEYLDRVMLNAANP